MRNILVVNFSENEKAVVVNEFTQNIKETIGLDYNIIVIKSCEVKEPIVEIIYNPNEK